MLQRRHDGLWVDRLGFIAAMMLKWNTNKDGVDQYVFIASAFHTTPYEITSNEIDNSVLISFDMFTLLSAKGIARALTDDEAAAANLNEEIEEANEVLAQKEVATALRLKAEAAKPATTANPSAAAKPVKVADPLAPTVEQAAILAAASVVAATTRKGK
jgi:hypothetical protein